MIQTKELSPLPDEMLVFDLDRVPHQYFVTLKVSVSFQRFYSRPEIFSPSTRGRAGIVSEERLVCHEPPCCRTLLFTCAKTLKPGPAGKKNKLEDWLMWKTARPHWLKQLCRRANTLRPLFYGDTAINAFVCRDKSKTEGFAGRQRHIFSLHSCGADQPRPSCLPACLPSFSRIRSLLEINWQLTKVSLSIDTTWHR